MLEDAGAIDEKPGHRRHEEPEPARSLDVKPRGRDDARAVSPRLTRKRDIVKHDRGEESPESKRRRLDGPRRVSPMAMKRKDSVGNGRTGQSSFSSSFSGSKRSATGNEVQAASGTAKLPEREHQKDTGKGRSRPAPCNAQAQQQLPVAVIARPGAISQDDRPLQEGPASFDEAELRRGETKRKREEMGKAMQSRPTYNESFVREQKAGEGLSCTGTRLAMKASHSTKGFMFSSGSALHHGERSLTKKQQESGERVQVIATSSIPPLAHPATGTSPQDPSAPQNAVRAALAEARQALARREQNLEYQKQREEARREMDKVVQTVYFNDPYISPSDFES
ncbi:hypothetical protein ZWY2020_024448 [Hordeum vulgare]|nr:hypothetical protein ZWY2020_024448 [Hordeum vulgare]